MVSPDDDASQGDSTPRPGQIPETTPPPYGKVVTDAWVIEGMMQMQKTLGELMARTEQIKNSTANHQSGVRTDFKWTWSGLAAATVLLISALIFAYFRLEDRQVTLGTNLTKIETKLDDLLQRVPPIQVIPQRR